LSSLRQALRTPILTATAIVLALVVAAVASGAPTLSITTGPTGPTRDTTPSFGFSVGGATTVECSIDQGTPNWGPCAEADEHTSSSPLSDGAWTFRVRASDSVPETTTATRDFVVDTAEPAATITSGPTGATNDNLPTFGFNGEAGATFECSVDTGSAAYAPCSGGATSHSPATLADGSYTFRLRVSDAAGNETFRTRTFSVDTLAPETTITSTPLGTTDDESPTFQFSASEGGVTFECRLDSPTFSPCNSPKGYAGLGESGHTFAVRATDAVGNVGPEEVETFTVDQTNPSLAITDGPDGATNDSTPSFQFDAESGTTVECSVDQGTPVWGSCSSSGSHNAGELANGSYVFRVRAQDAVPHETIETRAFSVDTVVPDTAIAGGPSGLTNTANPSFSFTASEPGTTFQCRRDAEAFAPCTSPKAYANLAQGGHTFEVRAIDAAGNTDSSAAATGFTVDTIAPILAIGFGPSGTTSDDSPLFEFSVSGASSFDCSIDQGTPAFGACSSPTSHVVARRLADGAYAFRLRAADLAGNVAIATRTFFVSTGAPPPTPPTSPTAPPTAGPQLMSPFPLVRLTGRLTRRGANVRVLTVRGPRGALARVRVKPYCGRGAKARRRCPAKQAGARIAKSRVARFKRFELTYRAGTTIEVRVSQAGKIGKFTRFVIRRGKAPQRLDRCLMPGATRGSACPTG
jgi:hypothetical protein